MPLRNTLATRVHAEKDRFTIRVLGKGLMAVPGSTYNGSVFDVAQPSGWCGTATCVSTSDDPAGYSVFVTNHHVMGSSGSQFHKIFADMPDGRLVKLTPLAWHTVEPKKCDRGLSWRVSDVAVVRLDHTDMATPDVPFKSPFLALPICEQQPAQDFWAVGHPNGVKQTAVAPGGFAVMEAMPQMGGWKAAAPVMSQFALPTTHGNSGGPFVFFKDGNEKKMAFCSLVAWGFESDQTRSYGVPFFAIQNILRITGAKIAPDGRVSYNQSPRNIGYVSVRRGVLNFTSRSSLECNGMLGTWSGRVSAEPQLRPGVSTLLKVNGKRVCTQLEAMMEMQRADSTKELRIDLKDSKQTPYSVTIPSSVQIAEMKTCSFLGNTFRGLDRPIAGRCSVEFHSPAGDWVPVQSAGLVNTDPAGHTRSAHVSQAIDVSSAGIAEFIQKTLKAASSMSSFALTLNGARASPGTTLQKELEAQMLAGTMPTFLQLTGRSLHMRLGSLAD